MQFNASLFFGALALALVVEGLPWLLAPEKARESLRQLLALPASMLQAAGATLIVLGIIAATLGIYCRS